MVAKIADGLLANTALERELDKVYTHHHLPTRDTYSPTHTYTSCSRA